MEENLEIEKTRDNILYLSVYTIDIDSLDSTDVLVVNAYNGKRKKFYHKVKSINTEKEFKILINQKIPIGTIISIGKKKTKVVEVWEKK